MREPETDVGPDNFDPAVVNLEEADLEKLYEKPTELTRRQKIIRWSIVIVVTLGIGIVVGYLAKKALDKATLKSVGVPDPGEGWKKLEYMKDVQQLSVVNTPSGELIVKIQFKSGVVMEVPQECFMEGQVTIPGLGGSQVQWMISDGQLFVRTNDELIEQVACEQITVRSK